jgi:hypothetical protein
MKPLVYVNADDKRRAWRAVYERQDLKMIHHTKFTELTRLDLSDPEIYTLTMNDIKETRDQLRDSKRFPKMSTYPRSAPLGLSDMGYNLGVHKLGTVCVKFTPAVTGKQQRRNHTGYSRARSATGRCGRCSKGR